MAKLTKTQLKGIVKECLIEILTEGLSSDGMTHLIEPMNETRTRAPKRSSRKRIPTRASSPALEKTTYAPHSVHPAPQPHDRFETAIEETVGTLTNDPLMSQILADTARTTLQEQSGADTAPGQISQQESFAPGQNISDIDIFAEGAKNWATLAFAGDKTPGND